KDETSLKEDDWNRTTWILSHGSLAAGYLTGSLGVTSVSSAASTGIMDLRTNQWCEGMLHALEGKKHRELAWTALPEIVAGDEPLGLLSDSIAADGNVLGDIRPLIFPALDDQAAGLVGGGATDAGHLAIVLGNSAVVNSSWDFIP